jgi:hypothetical protein
MWVEEGWRGYMRGNGINVLRIMRACPVVALVR